METRGLLELLDRECIPAVGCTEPAAIALATAVAYHEIGGTPLAIDLSLSVSMFKNAWAAGIPGTSDQGIDAAALLGVLVNRPEAGLSLFSLVSDREADGIGWLRRTCRVTVKAEADAPAVYIRARVVTDRGAAAALTLHRHDAARLVESDRKAGAPGADGVSQECDTESIRALGSLEDIVRAIVDADPRSLEFLVSRAQLNLEMAEEGLRMSGGMGVRALRDSRWATAVFGTGLAHRLSLSTAAACDARMAGVQRPVATCAGSGNLGIAATVPLMLAAREVCPPGASMARALALSLATTVYAKEFLGRLSPICGCAVAAGAGTAVGLAYLLGGGVVEMSRAATNVVGTLAGMLCDGAKVGCSLKLSASAATACQAAILALEGKAVPDGNGIVGRDIEATLSNLATVGSEAARHVDPVLLAIIQGTKRRAGEVEA